MRSRRAAGWAGRKAGRALALLSALSVFAGCSKVLGLGDLIPDRRSGPTCTSTCGTQNCGQCPTSPMVQVPGTGYQIDAHEVTVSEYAAFMATNPSTSGQGPRCSWNDSFEPGWISQGARDAANQVGWGIDETSCVGWLEAQTSLRGNRPVACIDYCDAAAYCRWAGKHLCGKIGGGTLDVSSPDHSTAATDASLSEWYAACSSGGSNLYPYGSAYMKGVCNDKQNDLEDVGSFPGCTGGPPGVFDMSGNVAEWTDECTSYGNRPAAAQNCLHRGGAFYSESTDLTCGKDAKGMTVDHESIIGLPNDVTGFRCCM